MFGGVMRLLKSMALAAAVFSSGCATQMAWQRTDGGRVHGWAFQRAISECRGRAWDRDEAAVEVMRRCMARRGFVWAAVYDNGGYNEYNGYNRHSRRYDDDD